MLSIVIVHAFRADLLNDCLDSVYRNLAGFDYEIIIVSNGSKDEDKQQLLQKFPGLNWIDTGYNAGFARGNNIGLRVAKGDAFLLLNPDTIALDNSIQTCYERFRKSEYVAAGVQLLNPDRTPQISGSHFVKGGLNHLLPIPYWGDFIRWLGYRLNAKVPSIEQAKTIEEVDWISGAFLMVKRSVTQKVGLMDEDFFLYAEEVEWCSRLRKEGKLCIYGDLNIVHLEGATIDSVSKPKVKGYANLYDKKGLQLMVSNHLRVRKQYGVFWFLVLLLNYTWGFFVFLVCSFFHHLFTLRNPFGDFKRIGAFGKNLLSLWSFSPRIIANKPYFYKMF
jgi:GT2 family glycosyltransferase